MSTTAWLEFTLETGDKLAVHVDTIRLVWSRKRNMASIKVDNEDCSYDLKEKYNDVMSAIRALETDDVDEDSEADETVEQDNEPK